MLRALVCALALMALPLAACSPGATSQETAAGSAVAAPDAVSDDFHAVLHTATGDYPFTIEIADTPQEQQKGLMYRQDLAPDAGMLFDYGKEQRVSFWMQNTYIPLDMVFIAADGTVKHVHANAKPLDPTSIPSRFAVRFVLEIPGGRAAEIGLKEGDRLEHVRVVAPPA
jgi:uncharacterized membrane protein (UPF0127 family)